MYKRRLVEQRARHIAEDFPVLFVMGARETGKSTLLMHLFPDAPRVVFDPVQDIYRARVDPDAFLDNYSTQTILDEVQFVPELLSAIKRRVDLTDRSGQYLLTGCQHLSMLRNISETMAGRVGILNLENMSIYEELEDPSNWVEVLLEDPKLLRERFNGVLPDTNLYEIMWRGSLPRLIGKSDRAVPDFYASYITTYVERDVRLVENVDDLEKFGRFMALLAALTAQEINHTELGRELEIAGKTAQRWVQLLHYTYQWREIWPYSGNMIKRVSKKRKGYIRDTGMACYLQRIPSHDVLLGHPMLGALFETFCANLIFKLMSGLPLLANAYHWRTNGGAEVDLILEQNNILYPIEFKCRTFLKKHDARGLQAFRQTYTNKKIAPGIIVYAGKTCEWLDKDTLALPWNAIMGA